MRYVIAMIFAFIVAALTIVFLGSSVADYVVSRLSFESPDDADNLHMLVFVGTIVVGLLIGWLMGWVIGGGAKKTPAA